MNENLSLFYTTPFPINTDALALHCKCEPFGSEKMFLSVFSHILLIYVLLKRIICMKMRIAFEIFEFAFKFDDLMDVENAKFSLRTWTHFFIKKWEML